MSELGSSDNQEPTRPMIAHRAARGVLWTYLSFAGGKLLVFASTVVLARLLVPSQFGQVAFALLVISYLETVGDFGASSALIYEQVEKKAAANIAFLTSLGSAIGWFVIVYFTAPFIADFFNDPEVVPILRAMAWVFPITALGNVHDAILRKELDFGKRVIPDLASGAIKGLISILLAWYGWGAWSLVWGQVAGAAVTTFILWIVVPWRPSLTGSLALARRMFAYGSKIVSVNIVSAIVHDADYVVVGRVLGATALGLYTMAYKIPELTITMVIWVVGKVAFPVYAKLRDDPPALRAAFLSTLQYLSLLTVPVGVGLALLAGPFVGLFFGPAWIDAVPAMQALAVAGTVRSLGSHAGDVYKATNRADILVKLGIARAVILIPAMIWGAQFGIFGVAVAQVIVTAASTVVNLLIAGRVLQVSPLYLIAEFKNAAIGSLLMGVVVYTMSITLPEISPSAVRVAILVVTGAAVYAMYMLVFNRRVLHQAWSFMISAPKLTETR